MATEAAPAQSIISPEADMDLARRLRRADASAHADLCPASALRSTASPPHVWPGTKGSPRRSQSRASVPRSPPSAASTPARPP